MKIKEYINARPRLKKALRLIAVIGAIFSIGLNILIFTSLAVSCSQEKDNDVNVRQQVTPPVKNFYNQSNYVYLGSSEFGTYEYFNHMLSNLANYEYFYNTTYTINDFLNGQTIFIRPPSNSSFVFGTLTNGNYVLWDYVTGINLHLDRSDSYKDVMSYKFYWDSDTRWVEVKAYYIYSSTDKAYCVANMVTYNRNDMVDPETYVYRYDTTSSLKSVFPSDFTTFTYDQGYQAGKEAGYDLGHERGYYDGYSAGEVAGQSGSFNPLDMVRNSFRAIADILNIQLLPNLTLATLIFTPLIIVMVIAIVRMFKG